MVDALVRRFLGTAGSGLLDFYSEHALWINACLFLYAMLVVFARRNYAQAAQLILADFLHEHGDKLAKKSPKEIRALLVKFRIPWENARQAGWFPFIASPQGILLRLKSARTLEAIFPLDVLVETVVRQTSSRRT